MKKSFCIIVLSLCVVVVSAYGGEQAKTGFIPPIEIGGGKLALRGFAWWTVTSENGKTNNDIPYARLRANWDRPEGGLGTVLNFGHSGWDKGTVIEELFGKINLGNAWEIHAGRLFTGPGYFYPAPDKREMEKPKSVFFDAYAYGVMAVKKWEDGSSFRLSFTGKPGVAIDSKENWDTWCLGGRLEKKWDASSVAATIQITEEYRRFGADFVFKPVETVKVSGGVDYEQVLDDKASDRVGMYLFAGWRPVKAFEVDGRLEYLQMLARTWTEYKTSRGKDGKVTTEKVQCKSSDAHDTAVTLGARFFPVALFQKAQQGDCDWLSITADVRFPLENEGSAKDPSFWLKSQISF